MPKPNRILSFRPSPEVAAVVDDEAAATGQPVSSILDRHVQFSALGTLSAEDVDILRSAVLNTRHPCPRCGRTTDTPHREDVCRPCTRDMAAGSPDADRLALARIMGFAPGHLIDPAFLEAAREAGLFRLYSELDPQPDPPARPWAHVDPTALAELWDDFYARDTTPKVLVDRINGRLVEPRLHATGPTRTTSRPRPATPAERRSEAEATAARTAAHAEERRRRRLERLRRDHAALTARLAAAEAEAEAEPPAQ